MLPRNRYEFVVQSIDTAFSEEPGSGYSVCLFFGLTEGVWHIIDHYRRAYKDLRPEMLSLFGRWNPDKVIIERAGVGWSLVSDMRDAVAPGKKGRIIYYNPLVDKETRVEVECVKLEQGLVAVPEEAHWRDEFRKEIIGFPNATHDDQVDALTQFLEWLSSPRGKSALAPRAPDGRRYSVRRPDPPRRR